MKSRILWTGLGAMALCTTVFADTVEPSHRVQWLTSVTEGYYNDPANWTGGLVPSNGIDGLYGYVNFQANDVTIKAPPGGLEEDSGSIFLGTGAGTHTLTIDTRGSFWEKKNLKSVNDWWGSPFAQNLTGTHIFNFEGLVRNGVTPAVWRFEDALFTWKSTGASQQDFDLWSGKFSLSSQLYLGSAGGNVNFYIHPEATLESTGWFYQRGNATTHTWFLGGNHSFLSLALKDANAGSGTTWMHITNDAVVPRRRSHNDEPVQPRRPVFARFGLAVRRGGLRGSPRVRHGRSGGGGSRGGRDLRGPQIVPVFQLVGTGDAFRELQHHHRRCHRHREPVGTGLIWGTRTQGRCGAVVESVCGQLAVPGVAFQPRFRRAVHGGRTLARDGQSGVVH